MNYRFLLPLFIMTILFSCKNKKGNLNDTPKPSGNCVYARNEKDPMGKRIRVLEDEVFISLAVPVSDSVSKKNYDDEFMKGYLCCVSVDTVTGIYFRFRINSADAFQIYGLIKKGNRVTFILKSGKTVEVNFGNTFSGNTDLSKEVTEYSALAYLSK